MGGGRAQAGLELHVARCSREWDDIPDVLHAGDEVHHSLQTKTEPSVRHGTEASQIEIPPIMLRVQPRRLQALEKHVVSLFALAPADDLAHSRHEYVHGSDRL